MRYFLSVLMLQAIGCGEKETEVNSELDSGLYTNTEEEVDNSVYCNEDPSQNLVEQDQDCDGTLAEYDCDDNDPHSTIIAQDQDCDGIVFVDDCDDNDANSHTLAEDGDCDGILTADDCNDQDSGLPSVDDQDCDGASGAEDCNDQDPQIGSISEDQDCDGVPTVQDCDDTDANVRGGRQTRIQELSTGNYYSTDQVSYEIYNPDGTLLFEGSQSDTHLTFEMFNAGGEPLRNYWCYGGSPWGCSEQILWSYDSAGRLTSRVFIDDFYGNSDRTTLYFYDSDGNLSRMEDSFESANVPVEDYYVFDLEEEYTYDSNGDLILMEGETQGAEPHLDENDNFYTHNYNYTYEENYTYDLTGNLIEQDRYEDSVLVSEDIWEFDSNQNLTLYSTTGYAEYYTYDSNNRILSQENHDQYGLVWRIDWSYDAGGNMLSVVADHIDGVRHQALYWTYDSSGKVLSEEEVYNSYYSQNHHIIYWGYDSNGNMLSEFWDYDMNGSIDRTTYWTYNSAGELETEVVDINNDGVTMRYREYEHTYFCEPFIEAYPQEFPEVF